MKIKTLGWVALALLLVCSGTRPARAKWATVALMPVARLLKTTADFIKAHPKDSKGYYMLGRINSAAFATDAEAVAADTNAPLPRFRGNAESPVHPRAGSKPISQAALKYYGDSVRNYRNATQLDATSAIAWLGLGFECEEGLRAPQTVVKAVEILGLQQTQGREALRAEALRYYRRAYMQSAEPSAKDPYSGFGKPIGLEAAEGIVRLHTSRTLSSAEQAELARMANAIKDLQRRPRVITPILVSFEGKTRLSDLLSPNTRVHFDLSGDEMGRAWPWVKPETGILVWDPQHTGQITSGLQLFGSVTWWLFWKDGYEPLAALDEDHDGWLEGAELKGIAVWFDRNGNGISEPGEVVTLELLGVRRISVRAIGRRDGALWNPAGIELSNGRQFPTFDWTPESLPSKPRAAK